MEFFAISNGIPVHILDTKSGDKVIVLLHGYLETLYIYTEFIELLKTKYRVIAIDLPGHGLTGSHKDVNTMDFCATVVSEVLNVCKIENQEIYIIGHSMGGYVAQACIRLYPDKFSGLVMLNSIPYEDAPEKIKDREREIELVNSAKLSTIVSISVPTMYAQENLRRLDDKIIETIEIADTHDPQGIVACIKGLMSRENSVNTLKSLSKLLIIFGDKDKFVTEEKRAQIEQDLPNAITFTIPNTGHNSFVENPEKTLEIIENFIG